MLACERSSSHKGLWIRGCSLWALAVAERWDTQGQFQRGSDSGQSG